MPQIYGRAEGYVTYREQQSYKLDLMQIWELGDFFATEVKKNWSLSSKKRKLVKEHLDLKKKMAHL